MAYLALKLVADIGDMTFDERQALVSKVEALFCSDHDNPSTECPVLMCPSTVVDTLEKAIAWALD